MHWYGADWYLPAIYACAQGMVFHLFSAVPEAERYSESGAVWVPGLSENGKAAALLAHYGLAQAHPGRAWRCMRVQLPWATKRRPERLRSLSVTLKPDPVTLPCPAVFETSPDCTPFEVKFALPSGAEHTLHVLGCAPDRLAEPIRDEASLWPREFCVLRYTVTPALPGEIQLQPADRSQGDPPRRPGKAKGSVVIGGAAAVCLLQRKEEAERAAASALYFEPPRSVAWRLRLSGTPDVGQADLCLL